LNNKTTNKGLGDQGSAKEKTDVKMETGYDMRIKKSSYATTHSKFEPDRKLRRNNHTAKQIVPVG